MRILLDECIPKTVKHSFSADGHQCSTAPEAGLAGKTNGELLAAAENKFDVLVTLDKSLHFQQNLAGRSIAIMLIRARSSRLSDILPCIPACLVALRSIQPGQVVQI